MNFELTPKVGIKNQLKESTSILFHKVVILYLFFSPITSILYPSGSLTKK